VEEEDQKSHEVSLDEDNDNIDPQSSLGTIFFCQVCWNKMCLTINLESFDDNKVLNIVNWTS
jgi:hypothetical protein